MTVFSFPAHIFTLHGMLPPCLGHELPLALSKIPIWRTAPTIMTTGVKKTWLLQPNPAIKPPRLFGQEK